MRVQLSLNHTLFPFVSFLPCHALYMGYCFIIISLMLSSTISFDLAFADIVVCCFVLYNNYKQTIIMPLLCSCRGFLLSSTSIPIKVMYFHLFVSYFSQTIQFFIFVGLQNHPKQLEHRHVLLLQTNRAMASRV